MSALASVCVRACVSPVCPCVRLVTSDYTTSERDVYRLPNRQTQRVKWDRRRRVKVSTWYLPSTRSSFFLFIAVCQSASKGLVSQQLLFHSSMHQRLFQPETFPNNTIHPPIRFHTIIKQLLLLLYFVEFSPSMNLALRSPGTKDISTNISRKFLITLKKILVSLSFFKTGN